MQILECINFVDTDHLKRIHFQYNDQAVKYLIIANVTLFVLTECRATTSLLHMPAMTYCD
jgi:hypothetical protein